MPNPDLKNDFRKEAERLKKSAHENRTAGEKRMLQTQATFYEVIAAQEDTAIQEREQPAVGEPPER